MLFEFLLILFGIASSAAGSDPNDYFTSPAENTGINPVYSLGDKLLVSWETKLGVFNVSFWQQSLVQQSAASKGNIYAKIHDTDTVTNFTWVVQLYGFDLSYSNVFFLWINPDGPNGFTSAYFNITEPPSTTSTSTATTATSTAPATIHSKTPLSSSTPSSSSSSAAADTQSAGLTSTGKIAIGAGIGVGLPIMCALCVLIWLNTHQPKNKTQSTPTANNLSSGLAIQQRPSSMPKEMSGLSAPTYYPELPSQSYT